MKALKRIKRFLKKIFRKAVKHDPLALLREDTYSNEELDEMTGRMHRAQYAREQEQLANDLNRLNS